MYNIFLNTLLVIEALVLLALLANKAVVFRKLSTEVIEFSTFTRWSYKLGAYNGHIRIARHEHCLEPKLVRNPMGWDYVFPLDMAEEDRLAFMRTAEPHVWYGDKRLMDLDVFREVFLNNNRNVKIVRNKLTTVKPKCVDALPMLETA